MPPLTRWFIKASLISLAAALLIRVLLAVLPAPYSGAFAPVFFHLFVWGWVTQIIFGVAYWMFPTFTKERPRGYEGLWTATFWCFNTGLIFRVIGEPLHVLRPEALWAWLTILAAILQWLAAIGFVVNIWGRVKER